LPEDRFAGAGLRVNKGVVNHELFAGKPAPTGFADSGGKLNPKGTTQTWPMFMNFAALG